MNCVTEVVPDTDPDHTDHNGESLSSENSGEDVINSSDLILIQSERGFGYYRLFDIFIQRPEKIDLSDPTPSIENDHE